MNDLGSRSVVSVVTVTRNNAAGLRLTLNSLALLKEPPFEVCVIDGGSEDETAQVAASFPDRIPLVFVSEPDTGIYDAMNKGRRRARGDLIHYLNAGDTVFGEPYAGLRKPALLTVHMVDERGSVVFEDVVKHGGFGYCHQGVVFPRTHPEYRTRFRLAADFDAIVATFPDGLQHLSRCRNGGVRYQLGGVSSQRRPALDRELRQIVREHLPLPVSLKVQVGLWLKSLMPRSLRRTLAAQATRLLEVRRPPEGR
jgi:glycosyltransferase involved in cell wall biosynthesis